MQSQGFRGAIVQMRAVGVQRRESPDVDIPQIDRRFTADDPFRDQSPGTAGVGDARRIESRTDKVAAQFRRLAENEIAVEGEAFRAVQQQLDLGCFEARRAMNGVGHQRLELIPVLWQQLKLEALGDPGNVPRLGDRLETAHHQSAHLFLVVDVAVGIAHHRQIGMDAGNRPRHDVEMLGRKQRHVDPRELAKFARPYSAAVHQALAPQLVFVATMPITHAGNRCLLDHDIDDLRLLDDACATEARSPGQRLRQIGWIGLAVAGNPYRAAKIVGAQQRINIARFGRADELECDAEAFGARHLPLEQLEALRRLRHIQAAALLPSGREAGLGFER